MDIEQDEQPAFGMSLGRDTLYVMVGDRFSLSPVFSPSADVPADVYWTSSADSVVSVADNVFTGVGEGWALVRATSVSRLLEDSCHVNVMRRWESTFRDYPYEMMVYASVTVHGQPFDSEAMVLGAFVEDELRGVGEPMEWHGRQYVRFRVGSSISYVDPDGLDETVTFRVYHRRQLLYEEFPQTIDFDGEAHGTLSSLFSLSL
jgi:hypothetical protein